MIRALRKRTRPDNLVNQVRAGGKSMARRLYLAAVTGVVVILLFQILGPLVFLDADGLVAKERTVISSEFNARVAEVYVKPGDVVKPGALLAVVASRELVEAIADMTTRRAQMTPREGQIKAQLEVNRQLVPAAAERLRRATDLMRKLDGQTGSEASADIGARRGQLVAREVQIMARIETIRQTLPDASRRADQARANLARLNDLSRRGLTTSQRLSEAQRDAYEAQRDVAPMASEAEALQTELKSIQQSKGEFEQALTASRALASAPRQAEAQREFYEAQREHTTLVAQHTALEEEQRGLATTLAELDRTLEQMRRTYNAGRVVAAAGGLVGPKVPSPGQVVRIGDPLVELFRGDAFVVGYVTTGRLYSVYEGDRVVVTDGRFRGTGRISRLEEVADALPAEFQSVFSARERQQVIRVVMDEGGQTFPINAKVKVTSWLTPTNAVSLIKGAVGGTAHFLVRTVLGGIQDLVVGLIFGPAEPVSAVEPTASIPVGR